ncbi:hypothetical protein [Promicromonospora sp. NPDC019610]|uniref:hypothetical protein n=1 Tax=Promicromonospora sp. NPDC019610 TaxID=3364405 RepID=UPI0037BA4D4E
MTRHDRARPHPSAAGGRRRAGRGGRCDADPGLFGRPVVVDHAIYGGEPGLAPAHDGELSRDG